MCSIFGLVLGLGTSLSLEDSSIPSIDSVRSIPAKASGEIAIGFKFAKAQAASRRTKRKGGGGAKIPEKKIPKHKKLPRGSYSDSGDKPDAKTKSESEDTWRATLPSGCIYDSYQSQSLGASAYDCSGVMYRESQRDGVDGYDTVKP
jgi:hypothetical protein